MWLDTCGGEMCDVAGQMWLENQCGGWTHVVARRVLSLDMFGVGEV